MLLLAHIEAHQPQEIVQGTVWLPVTDHYVNKVNFFSVNSKCQDCFYVADKGIIYSND